MSDPKKGDKNQMKISSFFQCDAKNKKTLFTCIEPVSESAKGGPMSPNSDLKSRRTTSGRKSSVDHGSGVIVLEDDDNNDFSHSSKITSQLNVTKRSSLCTVTDTGENSRLRARVDPNTPVKSHSEKGDLLAETKSSAFNESSSEQKENHGAQPHKLQNACNAKISKTCVRDTQCDTNLPVNRFTDPSEDFLIPDTPQQMMRPTASRYICPKPSVTLRSKLQPKLLPTLEPPAKVSQSVEDGRTRQKETSGKLHVLSRKAGKADTASTRLSSVSNRAQERGISIKSISQGKTTKRCSTKGLSPNSKRIAASPMRHVHPDSPDSPIHLSKGVLSTKTALTFGSCELAPTTKTEHVSGRKSLEYVECDGASMNNKVASPKNTTIENKNVHVHDSSNVSDHEDLKDPEKDNEGMLSKSMYIENVSCDPEVINCTAQNSSFLSIDGEHIRGEQLRTDPGCGPDVKVAIANEHNSSQGATVTEIRDRDQVNVTSTHPKSLGVATKEVNAVPAEAEDFYIEDPPTQVCNQMLQVQPADSKMSENDGHCQYIDDFAAMEEALNDNFSCLSPFKESVTAGSRADEPAMTFETYDPTRMPVPAAKYGRHTVSDVQPCPEQGFTELTLTRDDRKLERPEKCILQGVWQQTPVSLGDVVHVLAKRDGSGFYVVNNTDGLIVVNPDTLLSGTTVVSAVYCRRRCVLGQRFRDLDAGNIYMLHGSVIHAFFQEAVLKRMFDRSDLGKIAEKVIGEEQFLHDMYGLNVDEREVMSEIDKYISQVQNWAANHMSGIFGSSAQQDERHKKNGDDIKVCAVKDIEENIWSPKYGVKGKIDLTVEVKIHARSKSSRPYKKVVPLELKTGKASFSAEHKGQVTLYSMMMSDRRDNPEEGLLLYLKEGAMVSVPAHPASVRGLVQLRNELAAHLSRFVSRCDDRAPRPMSLPPPIDNVRSCSRCPQLLNCTLYQRSIEISTPPAGHAMESLLRDTLSHLSQCHMDYYSHWVTMLLLEMETEAQRRNLVDIWCMTGWEREQKGQAFAGLVLLDGNYDQDSELGSRQFAHTFKRHKNCTQHQLTMSGLHAGDSVVVSLDLPQEVAISSGIIREVCHSSLQLVLDRDLRLDREWRGHVYRVDLCDSFSTMISSFTNLSRLMLDTPHSTRLREVVADLRSPRERSTLGKDVVKRCKHVLKPLNKLQQRAVFKVLMADEYLLIKGFPGAGKTSTIVALIEALVLLGNSVLVTSYTHSAVDNLLLKLKQKGVDFLRLGRRSRIHADILPHSAEVLTCGLSVQQLTDFYASKMVVATTCLGVGHVLFTRRRFDYCIVDEATQVMQPACLGPLFCADRFVLVGDPRQLPPVIRSKEAKSMGMDESLFVRLDKPSCTVELSLQYRMNSEITRIANAITYKGALSCSSNAVASACLTLSVPKLTTNVPWLAEILDCHLEKSAQFLDTDQVPALQSYDSKKMVKNETEGKLATIISATLIKAGVKPCDIGIIAPYRNQVTLIKSMLSLRDDTLVEVNTVDQYQGRDKSVVIVSFVRTDATEGSVSSILRDTRRLNVAITRAKHKLILLGSLSTMRRYEPLANLIHSLRDDQVVALPTEAHVNHDTCQ
ncbi:PREDICTED: DNA replication ATP-dependent helicase/nuclease DNA2-like isoform X2 [Priapulus caudatus]|uniref:DNA replication ATP-dependent helicase/nuclease n=1 Tax=Priapulus caudatus TaxID=37621 RepID=A0ABM1EW32_PRICU|nr:PREDICTED: DNA replication ATP-dependent helicase/nuclease DNA2-like isoform X2 [Priapulus caudatus]